MKYYINSVILLLFISVLPVIAADTETDLFTTPTGDIPGYKLDSVIEIDSVPSDFPVGFSLMTESKHQYTAYYNSNREMTVASRVLPDGEWKYKVLPTKVGHDSHNYVTMAIDSKGYLHVSGNMHCVKLIYFKSKKPYDISTLTKVDSMVGQNENRCTYPKFIKGANDELIFNYRDGGSGNGNVFYNIYDVETGQWKRLLNTPLADGQGKMNAYILGPFQGPDKQFHISWVWRDTPDCSTNHDLSYAKSGNLIDWESIDSKPVKLPITLANKSLVVDPIQVDGGIINGTGKIGFDSENNVLLSYHKFDSDGNTQAYIARYEKGKWNISQISDWDYRWHFKGGGSIVFELRIGAVHPVKKGVLGVSFLHVKYGSGMIYVDEKMLKPIEVVIDEIANPDADTSSDPSKLYTRVAQDSGSSKNHNVVYKLRWETLEVNRDKKHDGDIPEPSVLKLYRYIKD